MTHFVGIVLKMKIQYLSVFSVSSLLIALSTGFGTSAPIATTNMKPGHSTTTIKYESTTSKPATSESDTAATPNTTTPEMKTSTIAPLTTILPTSTASVSMGDIGTEEMGDPISSRVTAHPNSTSSTFPAKPQPTTDSDSSFIYSTSQMLVLLVLCAFFVVGLAYLFYSRVVTQLQKRRKSVAVFKSVIEEDDDSSYMRLTALEPIDTQDELMDDCDSVEILVPGNDDTECYLRKTSPNEDDHKSYKNSQVAGLQLISTKDDMLLFEI